MSGRNRSCASANQVCRASSFSKQPPRVLIIDASPPWWSETRSVLCEALENFFCLSSSLEGPSRVPLLSLYAVDIQQECLLPFVQVKGNLVRLHSCVEELRSLPIEGCTRPRSELLKQAVLDSLQQYKQYTCHATLGRNITGSSVEVTILSGEPGRTVLRQLEQGLKGSDLVSLRRLAVVHIAVEQNLLDREPGWSPECCSADATEQPDEDLMLVAEMDLQLVENSVLAVENVLKTWLHDQSGEREHLQLLLPASVQAHGLKPNPAQKVNPVCIKCDMLERLVSPALLPGTPDLGAKTESLRDFLPSNQNLSTRSPPPPQLRVIKVLRAEGVCQSVLYGLPLIIRPTSCWQLDWEEIESNQQTFHALCHTLKGRDWFLLVRLEPEFSSGPGVFSYYVLQSSASFSLLLKPILTRELMLPCSLSISHEDPPANTLSMVEMCLEQLEEDLVFNPLCLSCNLYPHLRMRSLLSRSYSSHSHSQARGQRRDTNRPAEGATPRQMQHGRVRATVAPLSSALSAKTSRPPLTLSRSRPREPSLCLVDDEAASDLLKMS
ncbi:meiosis 1 arrest protein [Trichomycterus rosablanca]|uniref:meiosis 1 arrest protein n=1 Tax=Trichomycterus rosablanca TaxID=2290929 RepID=UPI002F3547C0